MSIGSGAPRAGQKQLPTALPVHASRLRDGCWNPARSGGTDPLEMATSAAAVAQGAHVEQRSIGVSSHGGMRATVTELKRPVYGLEGGITGVHRCGPFSAVEA